LKVPSRPKPDVRPGPSVSTQSSPASSKQITIEMKAIRPLFVLAIVVVLFGCASAGSPNAQKAIQVSPKDIVWRDASEDMSAIYLLRTPHDNSQVIASIDGVAVGTLPVSSYTVIMVPAGKHRLGTMKTGSMQGASAALEIEVKAQERRFFYLSGSLPTQSQASRIAGALAGPIVSTALYLHANGTRTAEEGTHRWTECTDLDARGLASIATFVSAESEKP